MEDELIIDAHVHTYPTAEVGRQAMQGFGQSGASGTVPELLALMRRGKISYAVMANLTPTYEMKMVALKGLPMGTPDEEKGKGEKEADEKVIARMKRRNLWSCAMARENPTLIPLVSVDILQTPADMEAEIENTMGHGARGLKLHPVVNHFSPDDRRMWPAYAKAMEVGFPLLFHSGQGELAGYDAADYGRPSHFEPLLRSFPKLTVILAHMGNGYLEEAVALAQKYGQVYFDISGIISFIGSQGGFSSDAHAVELIRKIGVNRVLFGSDWPWCDPLLAMERFNRLDLTYQEKQSILGQNAAKIFGLRE
jgi:predicted TIM-barrel fold metal-dependent hydrolase